MVHFADGSNENFGKPAEGFPDVVIRFVDRKVSRDILLDPRLGAAEAARFSRKSGQLRVSLRVALALKMS